MTSRPHSERPSYSVFVSYRRGDSADVLGRIFDRLRVRFGDEEFFRDVDDIALGVDFRQSISAAVGSAKVLLAVIGPQWLTVVGDDGERRLDDPDDFVRVEIEAALEQDMAVVPLFVRGATEPSAADLPKSLQPLAVRNGLVVRQDPDFDHDVERLIAALEGYGVGLEAAIERLDARATGASERQEWREAVSALEELQTLAPQAPGVGAQLAAAHLQLSLHEALSYREQGEVDQARSLLLRLTAQSPDFSPAAEELKSIEIELKESRRRRALASVGGVLVLALAALVVFTLTRPGPPTILASDNQTASVPAGSTTLSIPLAIEADAEVSITDVRSSGGGETDVAGTALKFSPDPGFSGEVAVEYRACLVGGECDSGSLLVTVEPTVPPTTVPPTTAAPTTIPSVTVPSLVGLDRETAAAEAQAAQLDVTFAPQDVPTLEEARSVVRQVPAPDNPVPVGSRITAFIGEASVMVDFRGREDGEISAESFEESGLTFAIRGNTQSCFGSVLSVAFVGAIADTFLEPSPGPDGADCSLLQVVITFAEPVAEISVLTHGELGSKDLVALDDDGLEIDRVHYEQFSSPQRIHRMTITSEEPLISEALFFGRPTFLWQVEVRR